MTRVKICGIRTGAEARAARECGVWAMGLVFAPSRRRIDPATAARICRGEGAGLLKIGVFVNESPARIRKIIQACGLDAVQLHGEEEPSIISEFDVPVIKSFPVFAPLEPGLLTRWQPWAYHFDSPGSKVGRGGTGCVFDWSHLARMAAGSRVIIAGGLEPDNVGRAIEMITPWAVDVSSGVEFPDGGKDPAAIQRFMDSVKEADRHVA